jgi:hypothetical protein
VAALLLLLLVVGDSLRRRMRIMDNVLLVCDIGTLLDRVKRSQQNKI